MGSGATSRLAIPYPVSTDPNNVPSDMQALATRLDNIAVNFSQGTDAARPVAGQQGRFYLATDSGHVYYDDGSTWHTLVGLTDTQTLSGKTLTSPTINGGVLDAASTIGGVSGTTLAADRTAWTPWTVVGWSNIVVGNSTIVASYKQIGKTVFFRLSFTAGSSSSVGSSDITWTPPVTPSTTADQWVVARAYNNASVLAGLGRIVTTNVMELWLPTSTTNGALAAWSGPMAGAAYATGAQFTVAGAYEAA